MFHNIRYTAFDDKYSVTSITNIKRGAVIKINKSIWCINLKSKLIGTRLLNMFNWKVIDIGDDGKHHRLDIASIHENGEEPMTYRITVSVEDIDNKVVEVISNE